MANSLVSVIMGVYNRAPYLDRTIESLISQTYGDFELICVDDGSSDGSRDVLDTWARQDRRIHVHAFPQNKGVAAALNEALLHVTGSYVAIADSDDVYLPQRFAEQVYFLQSNTDYVITSSSSIFVDEADKVIGWDNFPESDAAIRWRLFFNSPFVQPCVMFRSDLLKEVGIAYNPQYRAAEDYDLWSRLLRYGKGYNFRDPLVLYRRHSASLSSSIKSEQHGNRDAISASLLKAFFGEDTVDLPQTERIRRAFLNRARIFDTPQTRKLVVPEEQDVVKYLDYMGRYIRTMPRYEAEAFLHEEQTYLRRNHLSRIGLDDFYLPRLLSDALKACPL